MLGDGSDLRQLTTDPALDVEPAWSPDGSQIVFVSSRADPNTLDLWVMNADGSDQRSLLRIRGGLAMGPAWSPDGSKIALFSNSDGKFELYMIASDGTGLTNLTRNPANDSRPAWSPDGEKLAFVSDRDEGENLYTLDLATGQVTRLTYGLYADNLPKWSPDGTHILFASDRPGIKGIFTVAAGGGAEPVLAVSPALGDDSPVYAAGGQFILFASQRTQDWELYGVRTGTNAVVQLTSSKDYDRFPVWTP